VELLDLTSLLDLAACAKWDNAEDNSLLLAALDQMEVTHFKDRQA
jgi:hypothetical protein